MIEKTNLIFSQSQIKPKNFGLRTVLETMALTAINLFSRQKLKRVPEPEMITTCARAVEEYSKTANSSLSMVYGISLDYICRLSRNQEPKKVLELACGPGIFSEYLEKYLKPDELIGLDLSLQMLDKANNNKISNPNSKTKMNFYQQDIRDLSNFLDNSFNIVCFMDAAHHMPQLSGVTEVLKEADRVCDSSGLIFLVDPVRPKTNMLLERYFKFIKDMNGSLFKAHSEEFYNSLKAAWTPAEICKAVPSSTKRQWVYISPPGFKTMQIIVGIPKTTKKINIGSGISSTEAQEIVPDHFNFEWSLLKTILKYSRTKTLYKK